MKNIISPKFSIFLTVFLVFGNTRLVLAVDKFFQTCAVPKTCGNQNISFPFYIQRIQEDYCGYPGFQISCDSNGRPILNLSGDRYVIHRIFYENQSLIVSNVAFSSIQNHSRSCIPPVRSPSFDSEKFELASSESKVVYLYNKCNTSSLGADLLKYRIGCSAENETNSVLALPGNDLTELANATEKCGAEGGPVAVPVLGYHEGATAPEVLRKGFMLKWTASDCSVCSATGGKCGFDHYSYHFKCFCPDQPHAARCNPPGKSKSLAYKAAAAIGIIAVVVVLIVVTLYYFRKTKQNKTYHEVRSKLIKHGALQVTVYCYSDVKKMTRSFVDKLGQGGFGSVYKGELDDGRLVAVKVLKQSKREHALGKEKPRGIDDGLDQFINEVATISATSHVNVVTLLGFCFEPRFWFEGTRRALVFEYMSEGSLDKLLFDQSKMGKLNWEKRYQISIGIARGLEYLHTGCNKRIVHFDIKPGNILLDKDFVPKISDFGLAKTCSEKMSLVSMSGLRGTWGYIAPEIYYNRNFQGVSHKSDVYSYGMMVLDIVGARKNIDNIADNSSEAQFPDYIYKHLEVDEEMEMSERIINEEDRVQKRKMIIVSLWCIQNDPSNRPTMSNVIKMLEANLESLQAPPKRCPSFPSRTPPTNSSTTFESL